jgi:DNA-3-methyladenine glycosylase II
MMPRPPFRPRDAASRHLAADPEFAALIGRVGRCQLSVDRSRSPYEALVRAIAHQQVHGRAAEAILGRFTAPFPCDAFPTPDQVLALPDERFRAAGFSAAKTASIRDIALHARQGVVPTRAAAARIGDRILIERLVAIRGVGQWTVEMLLIFTLGRPDILPVDDFGVREGYRRLKGLAVQPKPKELGMIGLAWAPYRSTASWYLWRAAGEGKAITPAYTA